MYMCYCLVKNKITNEYKTLKSKDISEFLRLEKFFKTDPNLPQGKNIEFNFEIIEDFDKIKDILDNVFTSKNRGEDYNENLPSVSQIAYSLYPINIQSDKFLLRWQNNHEYTPEDKLETQNILSRGTFIHFILEQFICDKNGREQYKPLVDVLKMNPTKKVIKEINNKIISDIRKYIQIAYKDNEIIRKIENLDELKSELEELAIKCLPDFIREEIVLTDPVYSEIFISIDNYLQGSIDFCAYLNNQFSILDFKTTSSCDKKTGKPKFKTQTQAIPYSRQLALYNELLKKSKMTHYQNNEKPNFFIYQIHLISGKYKKFTISNEMIVSSKKELDKILKWYWDIRNNNKEEFYKDLEENKDEDLYYLTL